MWNWAGHPQMQARTSTDYSRFAFSGSRVLGLLAAGLLACHTAGNTAEPGSILSDEPEPAPVIEEAPADSVLSEQPTPVTAAPPPAQTRDESSLNPNVPLRYVVKKGDTLWDIADYFLKEPWKWPELWYGNPNIKNPHLIYPGDVLYLTYVDGKPRLSREPSYDGVEKLSPRVREEALAEAIPTIPGDAIRAFLLGTRVVGATELEEAPYIVEFIGEHLIGGAGTSAYAKGIEPNDLPNHIIVRKGDKYTDPETRELLGYEATYIGTSRLLTAGDPARVYIDTSVREVMVADRLLEQDETTLLDSAYYPHAPEGNIEGYIIAVTGGVSQIGQYQIVTLNKGTREGLEAGHVFSIYQAGRAVRDPYGSANATVKLPEEKAGLLMVFKTYERISYALVMKSTRSIHLLDRFRTPEK
jgi:hypothetical protein